MAYGYLPVDRDQLFLLPPSMREWLPEDHLAWFVLDVVSQLDTSVFHARHPNDGVGRRAYDPEMLLALLIYAYCSGVRSSRRIEQLCRSDVAYRVICANTAPDHSAIARFRADHEAAIAGTFVGVLVLCAAAGLTSLGTIAIDGTKMAASAALDANRGADGIRAEMERLEAEVARIVGEAARVDAAEDDEFGSARGDELPAELASPLRRLERLRRALDELAELEAAAAAEAADHARKAEEAAARGHTLNGRKPTEPNAAVARAEADVEVLQARLEAKRAARAASEARAGAEGRRLGGRKPFRTQAALAAATQRLDAARAAARASTPAAPRINLTDPDSRIMASPQGWVQGYNAQAAVNEHQIVIACDVTQQANDSRQLVPMTAATLANLTAAGIDERIGTMLFDAGYWSEANATAPGPDRLIATLKDWKQRRAALEMGHTDGPPPDGASPAVAMEHRLRTPDGAATYARRSCTVEPVFGDHKEQRGFRRFTRRGLGAVQAEWAFINATHNLLKLFRARTSAGLAAT
jgi:transposase